MKILIKGLLILFLITDLGYSFYQHYHMPLLGDIADIVVPAPDKGYYLVLHDPLGLNALINHKIYPNPNRFFAHFTTKEYLLHAPNLLQALVNPIDSVYLAVALLQIFVQILILYLLSSFISKINNISDLNFLIAAVLITPLFQTHGYNRLMGIVDQSIIYTFFYALSLALLLLFFKPFYKELYLKEEVNWSVAKIAAFVLFIPVLSLNGPLVPGVVLIACPIILWIHFYHFYKTTTGKSIVNRASIGIKAMSKPVLYYFIALCIFSAYSLYVGRNNSLNFPESISLGERYLRIPAGIYNLIVQKPAYPILFIYLIINTIIIKTRYFNNEGKKIVRIFSWIGIFSFVYMILLPLGGYRGYRANILRYDTIMPVTLALIFAFGSTSLFLINQLKGRPKNLYLIFLFLFLAAFSNADRLDTTGYKCERAALEELAHSDEKIVKLSGNCPIMDWEPKYNPNETRLICNLLYHWNITTEPKLYYNHE